jgi:hypothetical protein
LVRKIRKRKQETCELDDEQETKAQKFWLLNANSKLQWFAKNAHICQKAQNFGAKMWNL